MKQITCSVTRISNLPKKTYKKVYLQVKFIQKGREENSLTTCSFNLSSTTTSSTSSSSSSSSSLGDIFLSKDETRSRLQFNNVALNDGLICRIEVFAKQTMSRKLIGYFECDLFDFIKSNGSGKETTLVLTPVGACSLIFDVTPPIKEANTESEKNSSPSLIIPVTVSEPLSTFPSPSLPTHPHVHQEVDNKSKSDKSTNHDENDDDRSLLENTTTRRYQETNSQLNNFQPIHGESLLKTTKELSTNTNTSTSSVTTATVVTPPPSITSTTTTTTPPTSTTVTTAATATAMTTPRNEEINRYPATPSMDNENQIISSFDQHVAIPERTHPITPNRISFERLESDSEKKKKSELSEENVGSRTSFGPLNRQTSGRKKRDSGDSEGSLTRQSSLRSRKSEEIIDHRHAVAGTDSRVSSALIRQLSGRIDSNHTEQLKQKSESSRNLLQVSALTWLEQQIVDEELPTVLSNDQLSPRQPDTLNQSIFENRTSISPELIRKSPVVGDLRSSQKKASRTPFVHSYSTVLEDRDDATTSALSRLFEAEISISSPSSGFYDDSTSVRRLPKSEPTSESSVGDLSIDLNQHQHQHHHHQQQQQQEGRQSQLIPQPRLIKRKQSISTTSPRAYFDCDSDSDDQNKQQQQQQQQPNLISRFSSGKLTIPPIQIDTVNVDSPNIHSDDEEDGTRPFSPTMNAPSRRLSMGGQGIRRRNSVGSATKRGRRSLSTIRSVQSWDDKMSTADSIKANMQDLIHGDETLYNEFVDIGSEPGLEIWTVNMKQLSKVQDGSGIYYNHDCYLILSISNLNSKHMYSIFTWTGSQSERDKQIIVAFKAQNLSKYLGGIHIQHNREGEESDEFFEAIFGNFEVVEGTATESSLNILEKSSSYRAKNHHNTQIQARLLLVATSSHAVLSLLGGSQVAAADTPALRSIPIQRSSFQSQLALIFDTGEDLIYQWRGSLASQVSRARVFEAALSLRSERIKQNPGCRIEVVDEKNEPIEFWQSVDRHSTAVKRFPSKGSSFGDDNYSNLDEDENENLDENESDDDENRENEEHRGGSGGRNDAEEYDGDGDGNENGNGNNKDTDHDSNDNALGHSHGHGLSRHNSNHSKTKVSQEKSESFSSNSPFSRYGYYQSREMNSLTGEDEEEEEDDEIYYDIDEIKDYCSELIEGHSEMQRRQVLSHSRILNPNMLTEIQEDDEKNKKSMCYDVNQLDVNLYRIGYVDGQLHTSRLSGINSNGENLGRPKKEMLESKGVYILDYSEEVYVWVGKLSSADLRHAGMTVAKALVEHSKDKMITVDPINEGQEPILFKSKFPDWYESDLRKCIPKRVSHESAANQLTRDHSIPSPSKTFIDNSVTYMRSYHHKRRQHQQHQHHLQQHRHKKKNQIIIRSKISLHENHMYDDILERDNGAGVTVVWLIVGNQLQSIPKNEHGHFWTHEAYVILYGFTPISNGSEDDENDNEDEDEGGGRGGSGGGGKPQFILYFWQGSHTKEKAYPQWKLSILPQKQEEWMKQMGEIPHEIRVFQGKEPLHFFRIFKHRYIVHIAFLEIIRRRAQAEEKVKKVQHDILKHEKLRIFQNPVVPNMIIRRGTGVFSPTNSRILLNAARTTSPGHHRSPLSPEKKSKFSLSMSNLLQKDGSFSGIDNCVADDLTSHATPIGKSNYQMEKTNGVLLFQVKGSGLLDEDVHAVQIEACANRLNSSDCFIAIRPYRTGKSFVWLWVGRGSQFFEQEAAGALAIKLLKWIDHEMTGNQVRVVEEGAGEWFNRWIAKSFYRALGGFCLYTNFDLLQTPRYLRPAPLRYSQLFVCELIGGEYNITMMERFSQSDLHQAGAAILEAHYALFVWYGRNCNTALSVTSRKVAQKFLGTLRKGSCTVDRTVIEIQQDQETAPFISCFHGWCDWELLTKPYIDPRKVRLDVRQSMGLLGDMRASQGKPIEGLTTEQHQILAEEFKKRQQKLKEKEKETKIQIQHESVRIKIRQGHQQYELEHRPAPVEVKEVKKFIADASYNSPVCVPPPFATPTTELKSERDENEDEDELENEHENESSDKKKKKEHNNNNNNKNQEEKINSHSKSQSSSSSSPSSEKAQFNKVSVQRSKSFNNLRSPKLSESVRYQQLSIGRIDIKVKRSHSSNSLMSFSSPTSPSSHSHSPSSQFKSSLSITERIRNARPQLTCRDRVNLFHTSPMKSTDYYSDHHNNGSGGGTSSKFFLHSSLSNEYHEESITARIRRQREELTRNNSHNYSPPATTTATATATSPMNKKQISRQLTPPAFIGGSGGGSGGGGGESEKKERSITRLLAAAGLERQKKKYRKM